MSEIQKILNNGLKIPSIGFGTYQSGSNKETEKIVKYALEVGYRQIDTASFYGNEVGIGNGIKASKINREDIFLVTKLWND
ncbi:aldo/keto reductase, partial [Clostridioides difficile]